MNRLIYVPVVAILALAGCAAMQQILSLPGGVADADLARVTAVQDAATAIVFADDAIPTAAGLRLRAISTAAADAYINEINRTGDTSPAKIQAMLKASTAGMVYAYKKQFKRSLEQDIRATLNVQGNGQEQVLGLLRAAIIHRNPGLLK
jgi:hypothetical protein